MKLHTSSLCDLAHTISISKPSSANCLQVKMVQIPTGPYGGVIQAAVRATDALLCAGTTLNSHTIAVKH